MIRLVALLAFLPILASADPVTIRSGEHETFSRLVISIGHNTDWSIDPSDDGYVLKLDGRSDGFDTSQVFERIHRDRLIDVRQVAPNALSLFVECHCELDSFLWQPGRLVVDIIDSPDPVPAASDVVLDPLHVTSTPPIIRPAGTPLTLPNMLNISPLGIEASDQIRAEETQVEIDLSAAEEALAIGIARAASQGFLVPSTVETGQTEVEGDKVHLVPEQSDEHEPDVSIAPIRPGVGISTAMDRDLAQLGVELGRSLEQQCLSAELFQISTWGDDRAFHEQASALAETLAGEFGEEPREAQENLARLYIHFGFGAEARLVLAVSPASSQSRTILTELAGIVDDYDRDYPAILSQESCNTPGALWAFILRPTVQEESDRNQLIQHFYALPQPLRNQISPRLARGFLDIGDPAAASQLLHTANNQDAGSTHEAQTTRALIAEGFDDAEEALAVLSNEADDSVRTTPQSLIRLIELQLEQGTTPSEANLLLVGALRQEHRDTPVAQDLANIEAVGRMAAAQYQVALDLMQNREDIQALEIIDKIYEKIATHADSGTFLEFVFDEIPEGLTSATENAIAKRLIDLGFYERARSFLTGDAERAAAAERRYLRAESALGADDFALAMDALLGMTDERARALRARAYEGMGQHRAALSALNINQSASSPTLQFRAGAWERLTVEDDEVLSAFAHTVLVAPSDAPAATLAERREILTQSQDSRQSVENLLMRFTAETGGN
ncbi:hypothetical protein SAMN05444287_2549 [Octadecabacter temperatus]|uniref:Uncharacterized protein n=1 Tax=Octadecabacter temperatus TaxID=1458307 RepID=A0A0K0YA35_9RHOB|nr:hypothetical protein [Octadecabacter temperatus]AKS47794.1 hypothetical protein OSB_32810 [Octadecabacter temperatus]SIO38387.1 hypothetical protein SAMN05444287_2549 [Octadecabacter temperatus]